MVSRIAYDRLRQAFESITSLIGFANEACRRSAIHSNLCHGPAQFRCGVH